MIEPLQPEDLREGVPEEGASILAGAVCIATIGLALWGMKKISEHEREEKLSWKQFLFTNL